MKKIDIFIDLEGIGMPQTVARNLAKIKILGDELRLALVHEEYLVGSVTGFACYKRSRKVVPLRIQKALREAFESYGWEMVWSEDIADTALIDKVEQCLKDDALAEAVMLIANDQDFVPLVKRIQSSRRSVLVAGPAVGKRLQMIADRAVRLWDFLEGHSGVPKKNKNWKNEGLNFNPIPLP